MKKILTIILSLLISASVWAQSPEKMSYQAVIRDVGNTVIASQVVGMQISILQGGIAGTPVYTETQTPTTNINGLVSIEIGNGTAVLGTFSTIDWSNDTYFVKTETDPAGGTTYAITGTSQLLSVPYSLHAKTAESVAGGQASAITANTTKISLPAGGAEGATLQIVSGVPTWVLPSVSVGDFIYGGVVFWVDPTDDTKGLVCAVIDQSTGIQWYNLSNTTTGATGTAIKTGQTNTTAIIADQGATETDYAAGLAKAYTGGDYSDWFLPSQDELNQMYTNKAAINTTALANGGVGFANDYYWSSTEWINSNGYAYQQNFDDGFQTNFFPKSSLFYMRAVRAF
ncbi:MAG: DUF1566 domain-containing protein [Flavobacteriales bacterium]|nr:DUF1566 domain-containing protein [Flavobacteriales bacterium]